MAREPITYIEMDYDGCALDFGVGVCTAALSGPNPRKCYKTYFTCPKDVQPVFSKVTRTLRFSEPVRLSPDEGTFFPCLLSVSATTSTVNIAGGDDAMSAFGRRATINVSLQDFTYHDRLTDPYQAERVSGAAQIDEAGYDPATRGTFFGKLRARVPYYAGRALRRCQGFVENGLITDLRISHYVITGFSPPDDTGRVTIEATDVLDLAGNERALAPAPSEGYLLSDINTVAMALTLTPEGVGAKYPAAGRAVIGSEIVSYTRDVDAITITARALAGSSLTSHKAGDTFQTVLHVDRMRVDDVIAMLLIDYAGVPPAFVPIEKWAEEITLWLTDLRLDTHITQPTAVSKLIGELAAAGLSIWWDDILQEIGLKTSRPPDQDTVYDLTDAANFKAVDIIDRDEARLTEVLFYSVQKDPTKGATDPDNYRRAGYTTSLNAKGPLAYGDSRTRRIFWRWFNLGSDSEVSLLSLRLLRRFVSSPIHLSATLDIKDRAIGLTDVLRVQTSGMTDVTGKPVTTLLQVISRSEADAGREVDMVAQAYQFDGKFGYCMPDDAADFDMASDLEKETGEFACDDITLLLPDGSAPYEAI